MTGVAGPLARRRASMSTAWGSRAPDVTALSMAWVRARRLGGRCSVTGCRGSACWAGVRNGWLAGRSGRLDLPAGAGVAHAEGGQAGQVDRGGQQPEVLGNPDQATDAGAPAAVAAAEQVRQLAFDLGSGGPVVGQPGGVALAGPGS